MHKNIEALFPVRGRWLRYLLVSFGCCVTLQLPLVLLFTAEIPSHNWKLQRFAASFAAIQHPPGTSCVRTVKQVGNFEPTGNQCEYLVAELRSYAGSEEQIRTFYAKSAITNPLTGRQQAVQLAFRKNGALSEGDALPRPYCEFQSWAAAVPPGSAAAQVYVVFVLDGGHDAGLDYRCQ